MQNPFVLLFQLNPKTYGYFTKCRLLVNNNNNNISTNRINSQNQRDAKAVFVDFLNTGLSKLMLSSGCFHTAQSFDPGVNADCISYHCRQKPDVSGFFDQLEISQLQGN